MFSITEIIIKMWYVPVFMIILIIYGIYESWYFKNRKDIKMDNNNITILYNSGAIMYEYKKHYFVFNNNSYEVLTKERMTEIYNAYKNMNVINRSYLSFIITDILGKNNQYIETKKEIACIDEQELNNIKSQMDLAIELKKGM